MRGQKTFINVVPLKENVLVKHVTYQQVMKSCGKPSCSRCHGTRRAHGPYWQLAEWDEVGHITRTHYVGKDLPPEAQEALTLKRFLLDPDFRQLVHRTEELLTERDRAQAEVVSFTRQVARLKKELADAKAKAAYSARSSSPALTTNLDQGRKVYRRLAVKYHPDHNPATGEVMRDLNELWEAVSKSQ